MISTETLDQIIKKMLLFKIKLAKKRYGYDKDMLDFLDKVEKLVNTPVITGTPPEEYTEEQRQQIKKVQDKIDIDDEII